MTGRRARMAAAAMAATAVLAAAVWAAVPDDVVARFEERSIRFTGGPFHDAEFRYRLLAPAKVEQGKRYPVVLFLHGSGERGDDNRESLKFLPTHLSEPAMREKYPCYLIVPQCPRSVMFTDLRGTRANPKRTDEPAPAMAAVVKMLDAVMTAEAAHVDADRVYVTGLSMGGYGTWDLASRIPQRLAAAAPICGGGDPASAAKLVGLPIWAWHGDADNAVPVERSRQMVEAIKAAGGEVKYTELPGVGHNSWDAAYTRADGVIPWLFEQTRKDRR